MSLLNQSTNNTSTMNARKIGKKKYNLVLCELHYSPIHGKTHDSCPNIEEHYLIIEMFDGKSGFILDELYNSVQYVEYDTDPEYINSDSDEESYDNSDEDNENMFIHISNIQKLYVTEYADISRAQNYIPHKTIRNYHNIISRPNYIRPEIAECFELPTLEHIAIIKTIWLKIIQRKWKVVFAARKIIIQMRTTPSSLVIRQLTGIWPKHCQILPGIKGMLSNLL
jgi:hypothetical protein